jgi:hypothetical protein
VFDVDEFFVGDIARLRCFLPEEVFERFTGFDGEGFGKVLGAVELRPVAFVSECDDPLLDGFRSCVILPAVIDVNG